MAKHEASATLSCPRCEEPFYCRLVDFLQQGAPLECPNCRLRLQERFLPASPTEPVQSCWVCGNRDLYFQKDFNPQLGFGIVLTLLAFVILTLLLWDVVLGLVLLGLLAATTIIVYLLLADCSVCYVCQCIYRGFPRNPRHRGHHPGLESLHRKEKEDWKARILR